MNAPLLAAALLALLAVCGCEPEAAPTAPPARPTATAAPLSDDDLPVSADFEDEAAMDIDDKTYKPALDALEKELEGS